MVLLDLNMPEMDGYQFLDRVRDDANLADVPVIVLTSAILDPDKRTLLQRAANILSKSDMSSSTLIDTIDRVVPRDSADMGTMTGSGDPHPRRRR